MLRALLLILTLLSQPAHAHFTEGTKVREIVAVERAGGTTVYVRAPLPLVFADTIAAAEAARTALVTPFLYPEITDAGIRYRASMRAIAEDADAFGTRLAGGLIFTRGGERLDPELAGFRLSPRRGRDRFDSAAAAKAALARPTTRLDPVFGDAIVEYALRLPPGAGALHVASALPEIALPSGVGIDNHLAREGSARILTATVPGQLMAPAAFPATTAEAFASFVAQGVHHIASGLDHVFLVICFALGIGWSRQLLRVVTAFTLGHSVTLALGAMGLVPVWAWFLPAIEAGIAVTVLLAALAAWQRRIAWRGGIAPAVMAAGVGLIHGFGFAAFLSDSLSPESPAFAPALAGFNTGLELGQLALVALTLTLAAGLARLSPRAEAAARMATLGAIALIAGSWAVARVGLML